MKRNRHHKTGQIGEKLAYDYLQNIGLAVIQRNYKCPLGEIDLVAQENETIIFIEVKTRTGHQFGGPEESVTKAKQRKIIQVALGYLAQYGLQDYAVRFDVIAITLTGNIHRLEHIEDAFDASF
ncbi:MAG: YraN family protein [Desulfobulbaceae bacterium]|nr:MAG: YraN family protein [Desulfobulbaceae bacterium]